MPGSTGIFLANDNDFTAIAGPNKFFAFGFTDGDLAALNLTYEPQLIVPEPQSIALMGMGLLLLGFAARRRVSRAA